MTQRPDTVGLVETLVENLRDRLSDDFGAVEVRKDLTAGVDGTFFVEWGGATEDGIRARLGEIGRELYSDLFDIFDGFRDSQMASFADPDDFIFTFSFPEFHSTGTGFTVEWWAQAVPQL